MHYELRENKYLFSKTSADRVATDTNGRPKCFAMQLDNSSRLLEDEEMPIDILAVVRARDDGFLA